MSSSLLKLYMITTNYHDWINGKHRYSWGSKNLSILKTFVNPLFPRWYRLLLYLLPYPFWFISGASANLFLFSRSLLSTWLALDSVKWAYLFHLGKYITSPCWYLFITMATWKTVTLQSFEQQQLRQLFLRWSPVSMRFAFLETDQMSKGKGDGKHAAISHYCIQAGNKYVASEDCFQVPVAYQI